MGNRGMKGQWAVLSLLGLLLGACSPPSASQVPGVDSTPTADASLDRPSTAPEGWLPQNREQKCNLPPAPPLGAMSLEAIVPSASLQRPLWVGPSPIDAFRVWSLEQGGRVLGITSEGQISTLLDLRVSRAGNEEGLLGLAIDPSFETNQFIYLYYSAANPRRSVVSRFRFDSFSNTIAPDTEEELLVVPQPFGNHNGGDIHFGPDRYLYISLGDGGGAGDPYGYAQDTTSLLGSIVRIDVGGPDVECMKAYRIPSDNPFSENGCGNDESLSKPEIWAWGLRNVWRMSFDISTGLLWGGDVGQDQKEEVSILEQGLNYGWKAVEADLCYVPNCVVGDFAPPIYSYPHSEGESVTGGLVYRGSQLPELWGQYVFGDYESGRIWALGADGQTQLLVESRRKITSFGMSPEGDLLVVSFDGGIEKLVRSNPDPTLPPFPRLLSETGCVSMLTTDAQDANLLPYFVNYPFWSDGLTKSRYVALPADGVIEFTGTAPARFPDGTVVVKNFYTQGSSGRPFPIETRLIHKEENQWSAFTYAWNAEGSDATLVETPREVSVFVRGANINWPLLARSQCDKCHIQNKGYPLGLSLEQLERPVRYSNGEQSQISAWVNRGFATASNTRPAPFPAPTSTPTDLNLQARTYLHVNCASCHQPEGPGDAEIDLRYQTAFADMNLCEVVSERDMLETAQGFLLKPGDPENSVLYQRMNRRDKHQMPPLGSNRIDTQGIDIIGAWILSLDDCLDN